MKIWVTHIQVCWKYDDIRWWQVVIFFFASSDANAGYLLPKFGAACLSSKYESFWYLYSLTSWIQLQLLLLESMCWNMMTSDDSRLSVFSSFFLTPVLDISSQKLLPFAFVKKTSFLFCPSLFGQLWHNGLRSIFWKEMSSAGVGKTKKRITTCHHLMSSYFHSYFLAPAAEAKLSSGYVFSISWDIKKIHTLTSRKMIVLL